MTYDLLIVIVSTVTSESALSIKGKIINDHRSSLNVELMQALVYLSDV